MDPIPSIEQYKEILPKQCHFSRDNYFYKIFFQNPIVMNILEIISEGENFFYVFINIML